MNSIINFKQNNCTYEKNYPCRPYYVPCDKKYIVHRVMHVLLQSFLSNGSKVIFFWKRTNENALFARCLTFFRRPNHCDHFLSQHSASSSVKKFTSWRFYWKVQKKISENIQCNELNYILSSFGRGCVWEHYKICFDAIVSTLIPCPINECINKTGI